MTRTPEAKRGVAKILKRIWKRNQSVDPAYVERVVSEELQEVRKARQGKR